VQEGPLCEISEHNKERLFDLFSWVVTPCNLVGGYKRFGEIRCPLHYGRSWDSGDTIGLYRQVAKKMVTRIQDKGTEPGSGHPIGIGGYWRCEKFSRLKTEATYSQD
jgi:hypothetical protein